ncbi:IclR family transcriptional regulator [Sphingomonas sp. BIUV-7]|uniref:IclR family transcriptional regulator n=1 Tax=Sphingomonas natans TaxID=3063330 RepID=A0ABT8YAG8_9SPHN|nr:IclR family transcriptional regulator [Sphingomonas sp. BIUV-7]MDO6415314.1 IclR family transcriptional regulator [Sphingomonas sp. BIUV-7]
MAHDDDTAAPRRRSIQSIEIGMRIVEALGVLGASPLGAIAQGVSIPGPQVHRYLQSLIASGMARQDPASGHYDLGPAALRLGLIALSRTDVFKVVDREMSGFVERSGQTVQISALSATGPTIVRIYNGRPALLTTLHVGAILPLLSSATGRVFLAFVPPSETAALVKSEQQRQLMEESQLNEIRESIERTGKAIESGTVIPGLHATAFPIFDLQGRATLVVTALTAIDDVAAREASVLELGSLCLQISAEVGWLGPD